MAITNQRTLDAVIIAGKGADCTKSPAGKKEDYPGDAVISRMLFIKIMLFP